MLGLKLPVCLFFMRNSFRSIGSQMYVFPPSLKHFWVVVYPWTIPLVCGCLHACSHGLSPWTGPYVPFYWEPSFMLLFLLRGAWVIQAERICSEACQHNWLLYGVSHQRQVSKVEQICLRWESPLGLPTLPPLTCWFIDLQPLPNESCPLVSHWNLLLSTYLC